jgi:hypothetical protein
MNEAERRPGAEGLPQRLAHAVAVAPGVGPLYSPLTLAAAQRP